MLQCMLFIFTSILNKLIKCNFHAIAIFMVTTLLTMKLQGDGQTMEMNGVAICWFATPCCVCRPMYLPPHVKFAAPCCLPPQFHCLPVPCDTCASNIRKWSFKLHLIPIF